MGRSVIYPEQTRRGPLDEPDMGRVCMLYDTAQLSVVHFLIMYRTLFSALASSLSPELAVRGRRIAWWCGVCCLGVHGSGTSRPGCGAIGDRIPQLGIVETLFRTANK